MHDHLRHGQALVIAFSYIRFSSAEQRQGDSLRRQTKAAEDWCQRNGVRLDASTTLHDLGRSAYLGEHRKNPDRNALAAFLKLVESGKVPRGSFLIIENLDRLTREHIQPALLLVLNLLQAGIRIVQLKPTELVFDDQSDTMPVMMMMVELSRGHSESAMRSERVGAAWQQKKACAREGRPQPVRRENRVNNMTLLTHRLPAWIRERNCKPELIPERAAVVKRIFALAGRGYGKYAICQRLIKDKVPPLGTSGTWHTSTIGYLLIDRRVLGEYQPRLKKGREKDGDVIAGYYPRVIEEAEWLAARAGAAERRTIGRGRTSLTRSAGGDGPFVNIFAGLLKNALTGDTYHCELRWAKLPDYPCPPVRVLISAGAHEGRGGSRTFPYRTFEAAILSCLREIDPHEILNGGSGPDPTLVLAGELEAIEAELTETAVFMEANGFSPTIGKRIKELESRKQDLVARLQEARQQAAFPLSETWGQAQTLAETLSKAADPVDARLRLRSALRRIIDKIYLVVVGRGHTRLCEAQVWFAGGERYRSYFLIHRPPRGNAVRGFPGRWYVNSITHPDDQLPFNQEDLRAGDEAKGVKEFLEVYQMDMIDQLLAKYGQKLPKEP
jgi:DNA invertase Pin-like site-specific DNA recombinase